MENISNILIDSLKGSIYKNDYMRQAEIFILLADKYINKKKYIYAVGIYNYVLNLYIYKLQNNLSYKIIKQIKEELSKIEIKFIESLKEKNNKIINKNEYLYENVNENHKNYLQKLRMWCQKKLDEIDICYNFNIYETNNKTWEQEAKLRKIQLEKAEAIYNIYHEVADKIKIFLQRLIKEVIAELGKPPCDYAIIGLGSLAREEMTPYSDLEFAILIAEEKDEYKNYFRKFTQLLHLKIINLGETILPALAIPELNNFSSMNDSDSWFYDEVTPRGFAFDGAMPQACKTPLGKRDKQGHIIYELIHTPEEMARFQGFKIDDSKRRYWFEIEPHLPNTLATITFITGEEYLACKYEEEVQEILDEKIFLNITLRQQWALKLLTEISYEFNPKIADPFQVSKNYDVKREFYRFVTMTLDLLALFMDLDNISKEQTHVAIKTSRDRIKNSYLFDYPAKENLEVAISIAIELRLRTYLANQAQRDDLKVYELFDININRDVKGKDVICNNIDLDILFRYYYTVLPLHSLIKNFCSNKQLLITDLFKSSLFNQAYIHKKLLYFDLAKINFERAFETNSNNFNILSNLAIVYVQVDEYKMAKVCFEELLAKQDIVQLTEATLINLILAYGLICQKISQYLKCLRNNENTDKQAQALHRYGYDYSDLKPSLNTLTEIHSLLEEYYIDVIKKHSDYSQKREKLHGEKVPKIIAASVNHLAAAYRGLSQVAKAIAQQKNSLTREDENNILQTYANDNFSFLIRSDLVKLSSDLNKCINAIEKYIIVPNIIEYLYKGRSFDLDEVVVSLNNLGLAYEEMSKHDQAMKCYKLALAFKEPYYEHLSIRTSSDYLNYIHLLRNKIPDNQKKVLFKEINSSITEVISQKIMRWLDKKTLYQIAPCVSKSWQQFVIKQKGLNNESELKVSELALVTNPQVYKNANRK